jgi:hypothetical protein
MQSFNNNSVDAACARTFLAAGISFKFFHFVFREAWHWLEVWGPYFCRLSPDVPLVVTVLCSIVVWKKFVEESARGLHF